MPKRLETEARELTARIDQPMEMSVQDVVGQAQKVLEIMRQTMRAGIHYGAVIPGTNKRSLLKPGAERLCLTFRLAPSFNIRRQDLDGGHREYEIVATLQHQPTGMILGEGVGCASTMESKYRWRWENTGRQVPGDYWKARDPSVLGGSDFVRERSRAVVGLSSDRVRLAGGLSQHGAEDRQETSPC